ncbi:MAG: DeoR family transcriptional regulator [Bacteroidales bacterium]|nr:DeoR family transcriptional regulator [Candidatus Colicola coprequi]
MHQLHCEHLQQDIDQFQLSTTEKMVDKVQVAEKMVDKWSIKPSLADKLADIVEWMMDKDEITTEQLCSHFGYAATTAKRYLRQLTAFGYLVQKGANRNRSYKTI